MARVFLGLGSNVGDRLQFLQKAVDELGKTGGVMITKVSRVYETEPVGFVHQNDFLNLAVEAEVDLKPEALLLTVKEVEKKVGRTLSERWGPREVDIDILFYGDHSVQEGDLRIPHPELPKRRFVLVPLQELDRQLLHPLERKTVEQLLLHCPNKSSVRATELSVRL